jgi:hypothetical protein
MTGPGNPGPDRPDRPVEPYEPDPSTEPDPRGPEPDYPGRYPTYEDTPPTEPKDEEPVTLPKFSGKRIAVFETAVA